MPSPFPGMDPYIESPEVWTDFHANLATEIQTQLNRTIGPRYVARLNAYMTYEMVEVARIKVARPDIGIWGRKGPSQEEREGARVATAEPVGSRIPLEAPLQLLSVEVRRVESMELVTAIEILSPVNKRPGHDAFRDYRRKRRDLLRSSAHLMEIDLLRGGERPPLEDEVPVAPYYVMLSRAGGRPNVEVWPIKIEERLPAVPVPLLDPDADAVVDLATALESVYERGGYAVLIDYRRPPPPPPLSEEEAKWVDEMLRSRGRR